MTERQVLQALLDHPVFQVHPVLLEVLDHLELQERVD